MPIAVAKAFTCRAAGTMPALNWTSIQIPVTRNRVETTSRQKQCQRPRRFARERLSIQPITPPTRNAIATITVTEAEATTGKPRASRPRTIITIPSAWVRPRKRPSSSALRSRGRAAGSSSAVLKVAPEGMEMC